MTTERAAIVCLDLAENAGPTRPGNVSTITLDQSDAVHALLDALTEIEKRVIAAEKRIETLSKSP